jgi:hypothetical protein
MVRLIEDVHKQIYRIIPVDKIELRGDLRAYVDSLWNKAPEVRSGREVYLPYASILSTWIDPHGENLADWEIQVIKIFNGENKENINDYEEDMEDYDYMHHTMAHYDK